MAVVTHRDVDMCMIYDSFTITVLETIEDLGFCEKGKGGQFVSDDDIRFLPARCDSVRGYRLLEQAFPQEGYASRALFVLERQRAGVVIGRARHADGRAEVHERLVPVARAAWRHERIHEPPRAPGAGLTRSVVWPGARLARINHNSTHGVSIQLIERS